MNSNLNNVLYGLVLKKLLPDGMADVFGSVYLQKPIRGKFIVIEGIDGTGKSTQVDLLVQNLRNHQFIVQKEFEPTKNSIGRFIREQFLSGKETVDPRVHNLLFTADRMDHITNPDYGLLSRLDMGVHIVQDRYYLSSLAYNRQRGVSLETALEIQSVNMNLLRPDLTIFLDCDPNVCLERINKNREGKEIFETLDKLIETRRRYMRVMDLLKNDELFVVVDASKSMNHVHHDVFHIVHNFLSQ